jgi:nucleotide-binding universal stress UspA family protein
MAPVPTLVVKGRRNGAAWPPRRILVPTNGSAAARHAAEIAFLLAGEEEQEVVVLNVVQGAQTPYSLPPTARAERERETARGIVAELRALGEGEGVRTLAEVREGGDAETVILRFAREAGIDLVVLGTDVRPGSDRLFLGPRVERILDALPCPALVVNAS